MDTTVNKPTFFTRDPSFYKRFFKMIFFIALQNIIVFSVGLADNIMLGSYSEHALAGASLVNQIHFLLQMIVGGCTEGMIVLTSQYWGKKDITTLKKICSIAIRIAFSGALIMMVVCLLFPQQLLAMLTNDTEVINQGVQYLQILAFSFLIFAASNSLTGVLRSVENVRIGMFISLSALVVNISLNYILIFGHFGFPAMGVQGAAIATLASRCVEFVIAVIYTLYKEKVLRLRPKDLLSFEIPLFKDFIKCATPAMVTAGIWGLAMLIQSGILGHLGVEATAASSVAGSVFSIFTVITTAASSSSSVLIGATVGSGKLDVIKQYVHTLQVIFLSLGLVTGLSMFLCRGSIVSLYGDLSPATRELSMQFLAVLSITVVGTAYQASVLGGIVKAGGSPKVQMINDMISMWGIVLPLSLLSAFVWNWPAVVVFFILKSDQVFKCGVAFFVCNRYRWIKRWVREEN